MCLVQSANSASVFPPSQEDHVTLSDPTPRVLLYLRRVVSLTDGPFAATHIALAFTSYVAAVLAGTAFKVSRRQLRSLQHHTLCRPLRRRTYVSVSRLGIAW